MISILKRFFCLAFCFTIFTVLTSAVQNPPVMPAPVTPVQNTTPALPAPTPAAQVTPAQNTPATPPTSGLPTTAVPVAAPAPASAAQIPTSATPAATPAAQAPVKPTATPAAATSSSNYEKEFDELYQKLNQVASIKKELKQQLNEIEEKLDSARKIAIDSKETSFKIIQQSKTSDAEPLVAQVDKNLQSLLETQKKLNDVDLPKFEESAKKIQDVMQVIQTKMNELESKGLKLQISQAQLELQKKNPLSQETVSEKGVAPQATAAKTQTEKTMSQKLYQFTTDSIASGISKTKRAWQNLRNWVYSKPEAPAEVKKNSKPSDLASESAIKNVIDELDGILKHLDDIQISILQKYANIKSKAKNLEIRLKSSDEIRKYFERLDEENPTWKEAAVDVFSSAIDGIYVICKATKKTAHIFYDKFLKGFVHDVKDKIREQEKQPEKPLDAQPKELDAKTTTVPVMQVPAVK